MKKNYLILGLVIILFASCSTDEQAGTGTSGNQVTLSASITNSSTRVAESVDNTNGLLTDWSSDDSIDVLVCKDVYINNNTVVSMGKGSGNKFLATITDHSVAAGFSAGNTIYGVNNKYNDKITTVLNGVTQMKTTLDFTGQDGTVSNLKKYDLIYGKGDPTADITFNHKICVLRLDLNSDSLKADGITSIKGLKLKYVNSDFALYPSLFATKEVHNFGATCDSTITDADSIYLNNTNIAVAEGKASVYIAIPQRQHLYGKLYIHLKGSNGTISKAYDLTTPITLSDKSFAMSTVQSKTITNLSRTKAKVGYYLFSDGYWADLADSLSSSQPIAVIFSTTTSPTDQAIGWTHGYAIALKDASTSCKWGPSGTNPTEIYITTIPAEMADKDGYTHTTHLNSSVYPAAYAVINFPMTTPSNTSGWYLPSIGQWYDIWVNLCKMSTTIYVSVTYSDRPNVFYWYGSLTCASLLNNYLSRLIKGTYDLFQSQNYGYWCSSEYNSSRPFVAGFNSDDLVGVAVGYKVGSSPSSGSSNIARGVIAF